MNFLCHRIKVTAHHFHMKSTKKQVLNILVLLSGLIFLSLQIWETIQTFIEQRSTFAISQASFDKLKLPTIIVCPQILFDAGIYSWGKPADKDWYFGKLYQLNHQFKLKLYDWTWNNMSPNGTLVIGEEGNPFVKVEELMKPADGLCYALLYKSSLRSVDERLYLVAQFEKKVKMPKVDFYFVSPEDRYAFLLPKRGDLKPLVISLEGGEYAEVNINKFKWKYLPSKRNCKHYSVDNDTYMECQLKSQIECFLEISPSYGCWCVPENSLKTHFEMYPTSRNACQTTRDYKKCMNAWYGCSWNPVGCPLPCTKEIYHGQKIISNPINPWMLEPYMVTIQLQFTSLDVETHEEVLIQELSNFIGTVGGSLGLFIGFSYTGFVGKMIDFLFELF